MASITIRRLDDDLKQRLRLRAAANGRSMAAEVREILRVALIEPATPRNLAAFIRSRVAQMGGADIEAPSREAMREPPRFGR